MGLFRKNHETNKHQLYRSRRLICKSTYAVSKWKRQVVIEQTRFLSTVFLCREFKLENIYSGVNFCGKNVWVNFYLRELIIADSWKNRKNENPQKVRKKDQPPPAWFGIPTWPPSHCFETLIWPTWRHRWKRSIVFRFLPPHSRSHDDQIAGSLDQSTNHNSWSLQRLTDCFFFFHRLLRNTPTIWILLSR